MSSTTVMVVEDDNELREALMDTLDISGFDVLEANSVSSAITHWHTKKPDLIISDLNLGDSDGRELLKYIRKKNEQTPFILMTAYGTIDTAVLAMQEGASEFLQKPFESNVLLNLLDRYCVKQESNDDPVIEDERSQHLFDLARQIAQTQSTVLLNGPSGSGKEEMAKYIHKHSSRSEHPFIAINCAAIPENMLEATLFGYEKGAYTGAHQACAGKFEQAQHGTLLLDEISEMDINLQAKILRVIQEREVERLGSRKSINLDVRIIATTNRDLKEEVAQKHFREDLYFRLNVFPITCLSLIQRKKDIVPIANRLLEKYTKQNGKALMHLSDAAIDKLESYSWPGNVRELDNVIQRSVILSYDKNILPEHIMFETNDFLFEEALEEKEKTSSLEEGVKNHEFQLIIDALKKTNGKKKDVAEELGISPRTLRYKLAKMRELGIQLPN